MNDNENIVRYYMIYVYLACMMFFHETIIPDNMQLRTSHYAGFTAWHQSICLYCDHYSSNVGLFRLLLSFHTRTYVKSHSIVNSLHLTAFTLHIILIISSQILQIDRCFEFKWIHEFIPVHDPKDCDPRSKYTPAILYYSLLNKTTYVWKAFLDSNSLASINNKYL